MAISTKELKLILSAQDNTRPAFRGVDKSINKFSAAAGTLSKTLATLGVGVGVGSLVNDLFHVGRELEKLEANLITATGSQAAANAEFERLQKFAGETPYQIQELVESYIRLKNLGLQPTERALTSYGNTAAAMGKSLNQMIEAVADAATGEFERLKEFGIRAKSEGDKVVFTFQGIETAVGKSAKAIQEYLLKLGEDNFGGAMDRLLSTLDGSINQLSNNWTSLMGAIGKSGPMKEAARAVNGLAEAVGRLRQAIDPTDAEEMASLQAELAHTLEQISARDQYPNWVQWMWGDLEVYAKELETKIAALRARVVKKSQLAADESGSGVSTAAVEGSAGPRVAGSDYVPPKDDFWLIEARKKIAAANESLKVLQQYNRERYADDVATAEKMTDSWLQFEEGRKAAAERTQVQAIELQTSWQDAVQDSLDLLADYYDETFEGRIAGTVNSAFDSMEDAIVGFVRTGKLSVSDLVNSVLADLTRLTVQQTITGPISQALASGFSGLFGGASSAVAAGHATQFSGWANGGVFDAGGVRKFAAGGVVNRPTLFPFAGGTGLMGEAGPEAILPLKRIGGRIGVEASGAGVTMKQTINMDLRGADESALPKFTAAAEIIKQETLNAVRASLARGGEFYALTRG